MSGTTWVAWGSGRVPVGVNSNDTNFSTVEKTGGESTHKLTVSEMPSHTHTYRIMETSLVSAGSSGGYVQYSWQNPSTGSTGGDQPHNKLQPYITCYMWKRTN